MPRGISIKLSEAIPEGARISNLRRKWKTEGQITEYEFEENLEKAIINPI